MHTKKEYIIRFLRPSSFMREKQNPSLHMQYDQISVYFLYITQNLKSENDSFHLMFSVHPILVHGFRTWLHT